MSTTHEYSFINLIYFSHFLENAGFFSTEKYLFFIKIINKGVLYEDKKLLGFIAFVAIIGLAFTACGGDDAHTCSFGNWAKTSDATCQDKEQQERSCSCGEKQTQEVGVINPDGHSFTEYTPNNDAVCEGEDGTKTAICDHVGCEVEDTVTDIGSSLQHVFSTIPATCTTDSIPGTCTREGCGVPDQEALVPALGHEGLTAAFVATCTNS